MARRVHALLQSAQKDLVMLAFKLLVNTDGSNAWTMEDGGDGSSVPGVVVTRTSTGLFKVTLDREYVSCAFSSVSHHIPTASLDNVYECTITPDADVSDGGKVFNVQIWDVTGTAAVEIEASEVAVMLILKTSESK